MANEPYFSDKWEPKLEFWLKTRCPTCHKGNFLAVDFNSVRDVDGFQCHSCDLLYWLRPKWSVEEMYGHYLKSPDNPEGYKDFRELLSGEYDGGILNVIKGQSRTMSLVK